MLKPEHHLLQSFVEVRLLLDNCPLPQVQLVLRQLLRYKGHKDDVDGLLLLQQLLLSRDRKSNQHVWGAKQFKTMRAHLSPTY